MLNNLQLNTPRVAALQGKLRQPLGSGKKKKEKKSSSQKWCDLTSGIPVVCLCAKLMLRGVLTLSLLIFFVSHPESVDLKFVSISGGRRTI